MHRLLLPFAIAFLSSCAIQPVTLKKIDQFTTTKSGTGPAVSFNLVFHNPNAFAITISKVESKGTLNNLDIFDISIPANLRTTATNDFSIPVSASLKQFNLDQLLGTGLHLLFTNESVPINIKGKVKLKKFIFSKTYEFEFMEEIKKSELKKLF